MLKKFIVNKLQLPGLLSRVFTKSDINNFTNITIIFSVGLISRIMVGYY